MHRSALMASALALSLQGCATDNSEPASFNVRAVATATSQLSARDELYGSAAAAINRGDYGYALDLLQAARDRAGEDVRILNAFGVVYDKLGRFDLSQRYYAAARNLDPTSQIVAQNLAYSQILQGKNAPTVLAAAAKPPAPQPAAPSAAPLEPPAPAVVAPAATAALAQPPQVARTELRHAALGASLRPTSTLSVPPDAAAPIERAITFVPAAASGADAATPWDAPAILRPPQAEGAAPAPRRQAAAEAPRPTLAAAPLPSHGPAPLGGPQRVAETPKLAAVAVKPAAAPKSQARRTASPTPVNTAANSPPAHRRSPQQFAAHTSAPRASAMRTASVGRPAAAPAARPAARAVAIARPAPAERGWILAAAQEQVVRLVSRGLRFLDDLERCRGGCSRVAVPTNAKPTLRVTNTAPGGPPHLS